MIRLLVDSASDIAIHNDKNITHKIHTTKDSIIYKTLGEALLVNSRHNYALEKVHPPFKVTAVSQDNIIEAIEYINDNHFILGVQFHPEDLKNTENLYNYFIKEILRRKK